MNAEATSVSDNLNNLETKSHLSFKNIKIQNHNLFQKIKTENTGVLPELTSYFTTSMPLMTLNPNNLYPHKEKQKKLPKLSSQHLQQFTAQNAKSDIH